MNKRKSALTIIVMVIAGCTIMALIDGIISPNYGIKSIVKLVLFLALPFFYARMDKTISIKDLFSAHKKTLFYSLGLGVVVYVIIIAGYFFIQPYFDFSNVTASLQNRIGVNGSNFIIVAFYISFINSLLEEFFFRGFAFLCLKKVTSIRFAFIFSSLIFAIYHIAIMTNWFKPLLFIGLIISLFGAGILFNWIDEKRESIYPSWLVHMFANFAINTIGFMLFNLI